MSQLDPSRYRKLGNTFRYGTSDGLYYDATNNTLVLALGDSVVDVITASGSTADLEVTSEARGDILRRGASAWERHAAKASGQILVGDGTDIVSVAVSGDATLTSSGALTIAAAAVEASMLGANLKTGFIPLDITTAKIIAADAIGNTTEGLFPDGNTDPSLARVNAATDKALRLVWAATSVIEVQFAPFCYPPDLDDTAAVTVHLIAAMSDVNDTPTIAVSYWENTGDTNAGGNTGAVTGTALARYSVDIAHGDIGAYPKVATIGLTPAAHGTDALHLYGAYVTYTRKT
jgi:hypothetical protein